MTSVGVNYTYASVNVTGDGTGLEVQPVIVAGAIIKLKVISHGQNYTWCNISISGDGEDATARAIISPYKGHGYNAINELYASTLGIYSTIKFDLINNAYTNDYRQFGIIRNPTAPTDKLMRDAFASACFTIKVSDSSMFEPDNQVHIKDQPSSSYIVVGKTTAGDVILRGNTNSAINVGDVLVDQLNTTNLQTVVSVIPPTVNPYSGDIVFIDNRASIVQTAEQFISIRTTINF
jgi:hypothetical protein